MLIEAAVATTAAAVMVPATAAPRLRGVSSHGPSAGDAVSRVVI